jgi:hypothetical protein
MAATSRYWLRDGTAGVWGMLIREFDQVKLLSEVVEGGGTAKVGERARVGLLESLEQGIGGA